MRLPNLNPRHLPAVLAGSVALVAILVYANSLANGFAYDDDFIIVTRDIVHGLSNFPQLLTVEYWPPEFYSSLYRPLTLLSFAVDWTIWGGQPFGFHLTNVLINAAVSALLTLLLLRFFPWWAALAGGLVFAVHSLHTEAVANVVGRAELLTAFFAIAASLVYSRAVRRGPISAVTIAAIGVLYALAGLSKEVGVVLPALLLATDLPLVQSGRVAGLKEYIRARLPLFATLTGVLVLILAARWAVLGVALESVPDRAFTPDASFAARLFTMARVWPRYFELLLFPIDLSADYSPAVILPSSHLTPIGAVGFALVLATFALAIISYRRAPELAMAVGWAAVALLPVSNLIIAAEIVLAERTLYLPSVAVSIIVALLFSRAEPRSRVWLGSGLALWLVLFAGVTVRRNPVWDSTDTVFEDLRRRHPESSRLLWGIGSQYYRDGDWERAREWYGKSLQVWPYHAPYLSEYALILAQYGELAAADSMATRAVELNPDFPDYHRLSALIRLKRGDRAGTLRAVNRAIETVGGDLILYTLQADAYAELGDFQRAREAQELAVRTRDGGPNWDVLVRLALLTAAAGDTTAALTTLGEARRAPGARPLVADSLEGTLRGLP